MFGYVYMNMNIFVTTQVTKVILEPFCLFEPYLQEIPLRSKWEFVRAIFSLFLARIKKSLGQMRKFWGWIEVRRVITCCNQNVHVRGYKISNLGRLCSCSGYKISNRNHVHVRLDFSNFTTLFAGKFTTQLPKSRRIERLECNQLLGICVVNFAANSRLTKTWGRYVWTWGRIGDSPSGFSGRKST